MKKSDENYKKKQRRMLRQVFILTTSNCQKCKEYDYELKNLRKLKKHQ